MAAPAEGAALKSSGTSVSKEQPNVLAVKPPPGGVSAGGDLPAQPRAPGVAVLRAIVAKPGAEDVPAKGVTAGDVSSTTAVSAVAAVPPSASASAQVAPAEDLTDRLEMAMAEIRRLMAAKRPGRGG